MTAIFIDAGPAIKTGRVAPAKAMGENSKIGSKPTFLIVSAAAAS
jgi:hypothetical protein